MYSLNQLKSGVKRPGLMVSEINRLYSHTKNRCDYNPNGIDVFAEDWDNLLILDACRYDEFARHADLPGTLETRTSRGSTSPEFVRGNFRNKILYDVAYVSANGWYAKLKDEIRSDIHEFSFVERDAMNGLTSRPETVTEAAEDVAESFPNKRLIVHYMQPHQPFLGPTAADFDQRRGLQKTVRETDVTHREVVRAYWENLELVLDEMESLLDTLSGRTVITADHGEMLGERERPLPIRTYGHPEGVYTPQLVTVPWHVHETGERRDCTFEQPSTESDDYDFGEVERHLEDLGYLA